MAQGALNYTVCYTPSGFWMYRNFTDVLGRRMSLEDAAAAIYGFDPNCSGFYYLKGPVARRCALINGEVVDIAEVQP